LENKTMTQSQRMLTLHAVGAIEPTNRIVATEFRAKRFERLQRALAAHQLAGTRLDAVCRRCTDLDLALSRTPVGDVIKGLLVGLSGAACFVAEFFMTWDTLPFLLNIPKQSAGGVALGLTVPIVATTILHLVIDRLFETPWMNRAQAAGWRRAAATAAMAALLATLGAGTLYTIYLVGVDRGDAIRAHLALEQLLEGTGDGLLASLPVTETQSFIAVGVLLAIAGAVAFGVANVELRHAVARALLRSRLALARRRLLAGTNAHLSAGAEVEIARRAWADSDEQARCLGELRSANGLVELARVCEPPAPVRRTSLAIVDALLAENGESPRSHVA
jgi:hypothetical protein